VKSSKQKSIDRVLWTCIELEITKGHLIWRMSDLAKTSGVTRSLIYYYFGKSKKEILKQAVNYFADTFFDVRIEVIQRIRKGEMADLIKISRQRLLKSPYLLQFYAKHRLERTEINQIFEKAERKYLNNLIATLPSHWRSKSRILWAMIFGLTLLPEVSIDDIKSAEKILHRAWGTHRN
jgi:AcrR family transcriptional regulator